MQESTSFRQVRADSRHPDTVPELKPGRCPDRNNSRLARARAASSSSWRRRPRAGEPRRELHHSASSAILAVETTARSRASSSAASRKKATRSTSSTTATTRARRLDRRLRLCRPRSAAAGPSGLQVLRDIRARKPGLPVLILTAKDSPEERVAGLDSGADDYMGSRSRSPNCPRGSAPCSGAATPHESGLRVADLEMDIVRRTVRRGGTRDRSQAEGVRAARVS